ncbi:MAG: hypothetical protein K6F00_05285, partial [Lachnospiraceae bacterium]|nr:hypothetical protein [Lachnospiraceae bacterium]
MVFSTTIPRAAISIVIIRLLLIHLPEKFRKYIYMGDYYSQDPEKKQRAHIQRKASKIERKITAIIFSEALVLGITAAVTANILIPDVAESAIEESKAANSDFRDFFKEITRSKTDEESSDSAAEDRFQTDVSATDSESDDGTNKDRPLTRKKPNPEEESGLQEIKENTKIFVLNKVGLAFDLKLIMMIINVAIPFVVFAVYFAKTGIAIPIDQMAKSLRKFSDAEGHEKEKALYEIHALEIFTNDEIGILYASMDEMAEDVVDFIDTLRREQQLKEDLAVAQRSAEAKTNFLSSMSHEIRTPINAVLGLDEMIIRESHESDIKGYALDIKSAGRTLLSLINDILDSSKLEAGKMDIIPVEYELSSVVNDLVNMIQTKADDKGLELILNIDEGIPHILIGDEIRIKQVILNILTNAVKYTEEGSVTFNMGYEKKTDETIGLRVEIIDTGIGIKPEDIEKLYSPFQRIEEERNRKVEGTGLGMNIVKQLLDLMGTQLEVSSVYGEGSNFAFTVEQKVVKWEPIGNFSESYARAIAAMEKYKE